MSAELKPCPFCGGDAEFSGPSDADACWVQCRQCKTRGRLWDYGYQAEKAWNARAALTPPEGYVLVPVESVKPCACGCARYCCTHCGTELGGLAARPEVP